MRPSIRALWSFALLLLPGLVRADSYTPGFQLQVDGLAYTPTGKLTAADGAKLSTLLSSGPGLAITGMIGVRPHWIFGVRVAYFGSDKDASQRFTDVFNSTGQPFTDGAGPFTLNRRLRATPVHALLQYRRPFGGRWELSLEGGGGVVSARERLVLNSATGEKASAVGTQLDPSWTAGLGLAWLPGNNTDFVASARMIGTLSSDGAVWSKGDKPGYGSWTLGVRYPHDTR